MSDLLAQQGIEVLPGWRPENLDHRRPDLIIVGNVCRADNPEVRRAAELGLPRRSMPASIQELLLADRKALVVAGTHGKTTTSALLSTILLHGGADPTALVGGLVHDLNGSARWGEGPYFVLEGDEYDSAFFEKVPKFWSYSPWAAIITSVEHDHLDIYHDEESYRQAFAGLVTPMPQEGLLALWAGDAVAVDLGRQAPCRVITYGLEDEPWCGDELPTYQARLSAPNQWRRHWELSLRWPDGRRTRLLTPLPGRHNARNTLGAAILAHEVCGLSREIIAQGIGRFRGVALRQQFIGSRRGVRLYRDFAHHPAAVQETVRALRPLAEPGRLLVAYQPCSATACRRIHQEAYVEALARADDVILAPVTRPEIAPEERLDVAAIARRLRRRRQPATAASSLDQVARLLATRARPGDIVLLLSNGPFGHIEDRLFR
jgi:UDP-N-acetylmuramate: L-alanyl-gamma-D-glutamyl-meso-diaminopimelate ligase